MCATFQLSSKDIEGIKDIADQLTKKYGSEEAEESLNKDYYPKSNVPVIGPENKVSLLKWGFPMIGSGNVVFNARSESLTEKSMFKGILSNRCLVPATSFYEWDKSKVKYRISIDDQRLFYMAALWKKVVQADGKKDYYFTVITAAPNDQIKKIHNRMPAIITPEVSEIWLNNDAEAFNLLTPFAQGMSVNYA